MKNVFEIYETDTKAEIDGVWTKDMGNIRFKIARQGGKNSLFAKVFKDVRKRYDDDLWENMSTEDSNLVMMEVYAKSVIKDCQIKNKEDEWEQGVFIKEKNELKVVPFTTQNITKLFQLLPDLFSKVSGEAAEIKTFQKEQEEEQLKN